MRIHGPLELNCIEVLSQRGYLGRFNLRYLIVRVSNQQISLAIVAAILDIFYISVMCSFRNFVVGFVAL